MRPAASRTPLAGESCRVSNAGVQEGKLHASHFVTNLDDAVPNMAPLQATHGPKLNSQSVRPTVRRHTPAARSLLLVHLKRTVIV